MGSETRGVRKRRACGGMMSAGRCHLVSPLTLIGGLCRGSWAWTALEPLVPTAQRSRICEP
eukprot:11695637-Prorocentrum_lima.AAC.1